MKFEVVNMSDEYMIPCVGAHSVSWAVREILNFLYLMEILF